MKRHATTRSIYRFLGRAEAAVTSPVSQGSGLWTMFASTLVDRCLRCTVRLRGVLSGGGLVVANVFLSHSSADAEYAAGRHTHHPVLTCEIN